MKPSNLHWDIRKDPLRTSQESERPHPSEGSNDVARQIYVKDLGLRREPWVPCSHQPV
jgi:hypothetical protein